jgi:hypothetical protein
MLRVAGSPRPPAGELSITRPVGAGCSEFDSAQGQDATGRVVPHGLDGKLNSLLLALGRELPSMLGRR